MTDEERPGGHRGAESLFKDDTQPSADDRHARSGQLALFGIDAEEDDCGEWFAAALSFLGRLAKTGRPFTADNFHREMGGREPCHSNHVGAVFSAAQVLGLIEQVGFTCSVRASRHYGTQRIWRGRRDWREAAA
ncbi:hypothetical protein [Gordonia amicalis]|uniref:hypothetical protein n=1 Tax=Gordonia amicalis TaxID=89053 RepID=UPI0002A62F97|nr:hypothetical protein [Gordonia amicalis]NKX78664.1 hypothetical protein [Gordonia amicalis]GAC55546.1 hypothetical protein GOAMI_57_00130 [Gordonia amicalis NBRC 100051 = JCM 11271]